ncbi:hypothetical protein ACFOOP_09980 [Marinicaulis aureus]|uniref:Uncharacterized protein n=1 Tax=Hyphococcus aureus TaxID=2666033 RepID=A0ABW1KQ47_9PROT
MPYAVFTYGSGSAGSSPVSALRPTAPNRQPASAPSREDDALSGSSLRNADARKQEAAAASTANRQEAERRSAERADDRQIQNQRSADERASAADRNAENVRVAGQKNEAALRSAEAELKRLEAAGKSAQKSDQAKAAEEIDVNDADVPASREVRPEDIKKLEQIRAEALYPSPPTAESREIAQRAHTQIIRAEAELKAYALEQSIQKARERAIARFDADQAAAAYRQLEDYTGEGSLLLN